MTRRPRNGFATATAMAVVALAAVALASLAALLASDGRRTRDALNDAQLRQLLLAGADEAGRRVGADDAGAGGGTTVALPPDLEAAGGSVRLTVDPSGFGGGDVRVVHVEATYAGRRGGQVLRFRREGGGWRLANTQPEQVRRIDATTGLATTKPSGR